MASVTGSLGILRKNSHQAPLLYHLYFPPELKTVKACPLHKKDDPTETQNYGPLSLLSSTSKVFELVIFVILDKYLTENKFIT